MLPPEKAPPPEPSRKPLPECLAKLVRPKTFSEVMIEGFAHDVHELNTACKELDAFRRAYGVTDMEWQEMLASYAEHRHKERQRPLAERMTEPVTLLRLKWPSRLRLPPRGAPLEDYLAYIERMRPVADGARSPFASALNILQEMVERELGRQQRKRGKF